MATPRDFAFVSRDAFRSSEPKFRSLVGVGFPLPGLGGYRSP